jgi:hypothetical protein
VYLVRDLDRDPVETATALLKEKYNTFNLVDKPDPKKKCVFIQTLDNVQDAYRPTDLQSLRYFGKGVSKEEAQLLQECRKALIVSFSIPEKGISSGILAASKLILEVAREKRGFFKRTQVVRYVVE